MAPLLFTAGPTRQWLVVARVGGGAWGGEVASTVELVRVAPERTRHSSLTAARRGATGQQQPPRICTVRGGAVRVRGARTAGPGGQPRPRPHWWHGHRASAGSSTRYLPVTYRARAAITASWTSDHCTFPGPARRWSTGAELRLQVLRPRDQTTSGLWPGRFSPGPSGTGRCAPCRRPSPAAAGDLRGHDTERDEWRGGGLPPLAGDWFVELMRWTGVLDRGSIAYGPGWPRLLISYELLLVSHRGW